MAMTSVFDPNDANFANISDLENYEHSISGPPFSGVIIHDAVAEHRKRFAGKARDMSLNNYFVWPSANTIAPSDDQAKFYDMANFQLGINGTQAGLMGELWVEYSFTMIRRKKPEFAIGGSAIHLKSYADDATQASPLGLTPFTTMSPASAGVTLSGVAPGSTLSVFDMSGDLAGYSSSTVGLTNGTDTTINLPNVDGTWHVTFQWSGATSISAIPILTAGGGAVALLDNFNTLGGLGFFLAAGTSSMIQKVFQTTRDPSPVAVTNSIAVSGNTGMTDGNLDIWISRLPTTLVTANAPRVAQPTSLDFLLLQQRLARLEGMLSPALMVEDEEKEGAAIALPPKPLKRSAFHF